MCVKNESGQDIICLEICKRRQKNFELGKSVKNNFFCSCLSLIFAPYTLISPNLHIILKKDKITYLGRSQKGALVLKIATYLAINPRNGTLTKTQKTPSVL